MMLNNVYNAVASSDIIGKLIKCAFAKSDIIQYLIPMIVEVRLNYHRLIQ